MVNQVLVGNLVRTSCILSMFGAICVAITWYYPKENRSKQARILLFWLSFCDFISSFIYFLQSFNFDNGSTFCKTTALIDIFFPVASFLWTDCIAIYLYLVVTKRSFSISFDWKGLLWIFHGVTWSISLLVLLLVLCFNHAGKSSNDDLNDDDAFSNTGGWCWIVANNSTEQFLWELVGGKFIEWFSGLLLIPFLYISTAYQLYKLDSPLRKKFNLNELRTPEPSVDTGETINQIMLRHVLSGNQISNPKSLNSSPASDSELILQNSTNNTESSQNNQSQLGQVSQASSASRIYDDSSSYSMAELESASTSIRPSIVSSNQDPRKIESDIIRISDYTKKTQYFNSFYLKLALLPIVFIFIRFWSSIRVILLFAGDDKTANSPFLVVMQALFDPSQGFFNAILFVFFSSKDRQGISSAIKKIWKTIKKGFSNINSRYFLSKRIRELKKPINSAQDSQNDLDFNDFLASEKECGDDNRLSDFSFDGT